MCTQNKAIIYLRVSTDEQADSKLGLEAQESTCREFCQKQGLDPVGIFSDPGVSGSTMPTDREGLMEALASLKRGYVLVVAKRDRLARNVHAVSLLEMEVQRKKASIWSADGQAPSTDDDPVSVMLTQMLDVFSEFERGMIRSRTRAALQAKRSKGQLTSYRAPYGFRPIPNHPEKLLEPDPDEQVILSRMRELRQQGLNYRDITKKITEEGYRNRMGRPFQHASVHRILTRKPIAAFDTEVNA